MGKVLRTNSNFATIRVTLINKEKEYRALIDSGSTHCVCRKGLDLGEAKSLGVPLTMEVGNGNLVRTETPRDVALCDKEGKSWTLSLYPMDGLPDDLIIGMDFLTKHNAKINIGNRSI